MSFDSFLADAGAVWTRGEWLWEITVPGPAGNVVLRFSRRGTPTGDSTITVGTDTIPAHTPFAKRLLVAPSMVQALWKTRTILGGSVPTYGQIELQNADGGLDTYRPENGYRWAAAAAKGYFCDSEDIQGTIGKVFDGKIGGAEFGVGVPVKVTLLGRDGDFTAATSERVYRGTGYALEMFGDRTASFGSPAAVGVTGNMTVEGWLWLEAYPTGTVGYYTWLGGTGRPWGFAVNASGTLSLNRMIATVTQTKTSSAALGLKRWYHFAFSVAGAVPTFYLWDADAQTLTTEVLSAFTSATADAVAGGATFALRTASNATFLPWADELRVWNVARSASEIAADRHREIPSGAIPATLVHYIRCNDGAGTTVTDSSASAAHGTLSGAGTSTWLWVCEGTAELAGTPKPDHWGEGLNAPVLVDPIRYIYQVAGGGAVQSIVPDEGGVAHILDANAASMRALITTTPAAGHALPYLARGLFRLGSSPTLPICALVQGYNGGTVGYANAAGTITRKLVTERGPLLADPGSLDTASFTAYASASSAKMGLFLPRPVTIGAALDKVNAGAAGWWGFVRASPLFHVERFAGPAGVADYNFDLRHIVDVTPTGATPVVWEVVILFAFNPVVLSEDQAAATFKGTAGWQLRRQDWQEERRSDDALRARYPGAAGQSITIETCLQERAAAGALADYVLALVKGEKQGWMARLRATGLQLKVGQTLTLSYTLQDGTQRGGLDGTRRYVILSTEDLKQKEEVRAEVFP